MYCMFEWYICGMWKMESNLEKSAKFALTHEGESYWQIMAFFSLDLFVQRLYCYYPPISIVIYAVNTVLWNNCFIFVIAFPLSMICWFIVHEDVYINHLSLNHFSSLSFLCSETSYQHLSIRVSFTERKVGVLGRCHCSRSSSLVPPLPHVHRSLVTVIYTLSHFLYLPTSFPSLSVRHYD